jgi:hypothetical protein
MSRDADLFERGQHAGLDAAKLRATTRTAR